MLSNLLSELLSKTAPTPPANNNNNKPPRTHNRPIRTTYISNPVSLPASFLTTPSPDSLPITLTPLDFATSPLPEYSQCHALVLDNVLSPSECATLLRLAEASVPAPGQPGSELRHGPDDPWAPALVNVGGGFEVLEQEYRNSDRIVWDCQEVVDRIWGRSHCDAPFVDTRDPSRSIRTLFTIHLYLNDSKAEVEGAELVGGATTFYSGDEKRRIDVDPKAGRVLIFQHRRLLHSGDDVLAGTKYTMRTDILYEFIREEEKEDGEAGQ
ncbi:hypothetical protein NEMBOFW57_006073 [Staphylotrichum longicolle]|uniref:Prolyl 4-hydroxylase alpha subunit domain-containing protein n=1 Tax=Staphylotrichum longicolle TaxID=669026 RepID=A0AAD4HZ40_9PEZI|nr:hypothetical protein NEMBOFW57_006073 [Staphylotrichum longicolle]